MDYIFRFYTKHMQHCAAVMIPRQITVLASASQLLQVHTALPCF